MTEATRQDITTTSHRKYEGRHFPDLNPQTATRKHACKRFVLCMENCCGRAPSTDAMTAPFQCVQPHVSAYTTLLHGNPKNVNSVCEEVLL